MRSNHLFNNFTPALAALVACALFASAQVSASASPLHTAADEAAVREHVRQMEAGWNAKSGALFAKPFAEDADYVVVNGTHIKGRAAIDKGHQQIFDTIYKESTLGLKLKGVRFLRPDVAVAHVNAHLKHSRGESDGLITLVLTKDKGAWRISAFQNTGVAPVEGRRP